MWMGLLWIVGIYGICIAVIHAAYAVHRSKGTVPETTYIALITHNNELQIEWYLRSLIFFSWLRGRQIAITIFDEGSADGTLDIIERFSENRNSIQILVAEESLDAFLDLHQGDAVVVHRLMQLGKGEPLPVLQF